MIMKRSLVLVVALALFLGACATVTAPGKTGVVTKVEGNSVTVASGAETATYTLGNRTLLFAPDGGSAQRSYLSEGQRVMVWAEGTNAVRINIEP
jgi:ABC-type sugar transport system substrate-binding protein